MDFLEIGAEARQLNVMATSATIPVRLHPALVEQLDRYAAQLGVSRNAAIKLCLANQFGMIKSLQPGELLNLDGRSLRHRKPSADADASGMNDAAEEPAQGVNAQLKSEIQQIKEAKQRTAGAAGMDHLSAES